MLRRKTHRERSRGRAKIEREKNDDGVGEDLRGRTTKTEGTRDKTEKGGLGKGERYTHVEKMTTYNEM